jgi:CubicO group peptidase (beta-lactamase class C family)
MKILLVSCAVAVAVACSSPPRPEPAPVEPAAATTAPAPEPRQVAAETSITSDWGATITIPASWYVLEGPEVIRIEGPNRELTIWLAAATVADRDAAIEQAWKRIDPEFSLETAQTINVPGRDGWDAITQRVYVTRAEYQRVVMVSARRLGDVWHLAMIDGKVAAFQRRGAQISQIIDDMKLPGLDKESFAGKKPALDAEHLERFSAFVDEARGLARVPGVAVAVVHGGKVIFEKGYGVRTLGKKPKVTPDTLFAIGSITKSLTTLLLARLIDDGKLTWTTPVTEVLDTFALADPAVTARTQVLHTVCACTGMPRQDLEMLFEYKGWTPERRLASMKAMMPTTGFGETFQYSNLMVSTGGWIAARAHAPKRGLGPAYDAAMSKLVFAPLGMQSSTFDFARLARSNHASSHGRGLSADYQVIPLAYEKALLAVRPAGGAWSSARDMARYMMLELGRGTYRGKRLVSEENLTARYKPQIEINDEASYGLGLFISTEHDLRVIHHGGNALGQTADMFMLPEHDAGVVVLSNGGGANALRAAVRRAFIEIVFEGKKQARENLTAALANRETQLAELRGRISDPEPAWIDPLLGTYRAAGLGEITLAKDRDGYRLDAGEWHSRLAREVERNGTEFLTTVAPPYIGIDLQPKKRGDKTVLELDAGQQVYTFEPR